MGKIIELVRADKSGIYILPAGLSFDFVDVILVNGNPVDEGRYTILANNTAVDIFDAQDDSVITVIRA